MYQFLLKLWIWIIFFEKSEVGTSHAKQARLRCEKVIFTLDNFWFVEVKLWCDLCVVEVVRSTTTSILINYS